MKHSIALLFCLFLSLHNHLTAQPIRSYGVKIGMTIASQSWDYSGSLNGLVVFDDSRYGFIGGGYIEWFNYNSFGMVTGIEYIQKGSSDEFIVTSAASPDPIGKRKIYPRLDYLSIPVLLKMRYDLTQGSIYCLTGPRFDFFIGQNSDATGPVFENVTSMDYGITLGIGFELANIVTRQTGIEVKYNPSFNEIYSTNLLTVQNNSIDFTVLFMF